MNIVEQIEKDYLEAYKAHNELKVSVLRMVKTSLKNAEINKEAELSEEEAIEVLKRELKQRHESAEVYRQNGQNEAADKEEAEIKFIEPYLPAQLSEEETDKIVKNTIAEMGDVDQSKTGLIIGKIMGEYKGKVEGALVSKLVRENLTK